jgi:hypothetical protein
MGNTAVNRTEKSTTGPRVKSVTAALFRGTVCAVLETSTSSVAEETATIMLGHVSLPMLNSSIKWLNLIIFVV